VWGVGLVGGDPEFGGTLALFPLQTLVVGEFLRLFWVLGIFVVGPFVSGAKKNRCWEEGVLVVMSGGFWSLASFLGGLSVVGWAGSFLSCWGSGLGGL